MNVIKGKIRYQLKLFLMAFTVLWTLVGVFAYLEYRNVRAYRMDTIANRVDLAVSNILDGHDGGRDMQPFLNFLTSYLDESALSNLSINVYDNSTGEILYSLGPAIDSLPDDVKNAEPQLRSDGTRYLECFDINLDNGGHLFLYSKGVNKKGTITAHAYLVQSKRILNYLAVGSTFWLIVLFVGIVGTVMAWILTAHQAKNITLLHDFASRAATDRDFIPMGDFPADEIGDISRQIVAIYNSRMQANVRREREHAVALKAIEEKNNLKRVMTNNISHELKTPIGIIRSYVEMILSTPDMTDEERNHFLGKVMNNINRITAMMNDLSTMTRLEESGNKIPISAINFHDLVFSLAEDFTMSGLIKDFDFHYNIPLDCQVYGNGELMISLLSNLAKNAVAYSQGHNIGISMIARNENFYTFSFYDDGVGVGEEHLQHLFERFYRIDKGRSRKVGGTGLGLPIVKSSINTMGGSITVRNRKGGGLEFVFTLRRVKPTDSHAPAPTPPAAANPAANAPSAGNSTTNPTAK